MTSSQVPTNKAYLHQLFPPPPTPLPTHNAQQQQQHRSTPSTMISATPLGKPTSLRAQLFGSQPRISTQIPAKEAAYTSHAATTPAWLGGFYATESLAALHHMDGCSSRPDSIHDSGMHQHNHANHAISLSSSDARSSHAWKPTALRNTSSDDDDDDDDVHATTHRHPRRAVDEAQLIERALQRWQRRNRSGGGAHRHARSSSSHQHHHRCTASSCECGSSCSCHESSNFAHEPCGSSCTCSCSDCHPNTTSSRQDPFAEMAAEGVPPLVFLRKPPPIASHHDASSSKHGSAVVDESGDDLRVPAMMAPSRRRSTRDRTTQTHTTEVKAAPPPSSPSSDAQTKDEPTTTTTTTTTTTSSSSAEAAVVALAQRCEVHLHEQEKLLNESFAHMRTHLQTWAEERLSADATHRAHVQETLQTMLANSSPREVVRTTVGVSALCAWTEMQHNIGELAASEVREKLLHENELQHHTHQVEMAALRHAHDVEHQELRTQMIDALMREEDGRRMILQDYQMECVQQLHEMERLAHVACDERRAAEHHGSVAVECRRELMMLRLQHMLLLEEKHRAQMEREESFIFRVQIVQEMMLHTQRWSAELHPTRVAKEAHIQHLEERVAMMSEAAHQQDVREALLRTQLLQALRMPTTNIIAPSSATTTFTNEEDLPVHRRFARAHVEAVKAIRAQHVRVLR